MRKPKVVWPALLTRPMQVASGAGQAGVGEQDAPLLPDEDDEDELEEDVDDELEEDEVDEDDELADDAEDEPADDDALDEEELEPDPDEELDDDVDEELALDDEAEELDEELEPVFVPDPPHEATRAAAVTEPAQRIPLVLIIEA
jgi:hypothetical protein